MENNPDESVTPEKAILKSITDGNLVEFKNLLAQYNGDVDFFDENGMTALQHAAYGGSKEMVQLLIDRVSIQLSIMILQSMIKLNKNTFLQDHHLIK